jgi:hypothetical protein
MIEGSPRAHPERLQLLRRLRSRLPKLADPLEIVAEQILGLDSRIDFLLADSLAQRSWMEPRVADWLKLAPELGLRPELGVRVLLLAPQLDPRTISAAKSLEGLSVDLGICRPVSNGAGIEILIELLDAPPPISTAVAEPIVSQFRTGLREEDLGG